VSRPPAAALVLLLAACSSPAARPVTVAVPSVPIAADPLSPGARAVAAGGFHVCALLGDGTVVCAGSNATRQLGASRTTSDCRTTDHGDDEPRPCLRTPREVETPLRFSAISAGASHNCGLTAEGSIACWGQDAYGELGSQEDEQRCTVAGSTMPCRASPRLIAGAPRFASVAAGNSHTCGVDREGRARCWGVSSDGQLGAPPEGPACLFDFACSRAMVVAESPVRFASLAAGEHHTCGLTAGGAAYCWGSNAGGRLLGNARAPALMRFHDEPCTHVAQPVTGGLAFGALSSSDHHTCGLTREGRAYCWGDNESGQLGTGGGAGVAAPTLVAGDLRFTSIAAGGKHTCALTAEGVAHCWGSNEHGQLGRGGAGGDAGTTPGRVAGELRFASIGLGWRVSCGVTRGGEVYCWGADGEGELGDGDGPHARCGSLREACSTTPVRFRLPGSG
jgi:alpha-tubulin suppressor-like RCC1 family protein